MNPADIMAGLGRSKVVVYALCGIALRGNSGSEPFLQGDTTTNKNVFNLGQQKSKIDILCEPPDNRGNIKCLPNLVSMWIRWKVANNIEASYVIAYFAPFIWQFTEDISSFHCGSPKLSTFSLIYFVALVYGVASPCILTIKIDDEQKCSKSVQNALKLQNVMNIF